MSLVWIKEHDSKINITTSSDESGFVFVLFISKNSSSTYLMGYRFIDQLDRETVSQTERSVK
jgi:hypothetical protein